MTADLADIGVWDLVLYLGVLYHIEDPIAALRRVGAVTGRRAVHRDRGRRRPRLRARGAVALLSGAELNGDVSNWWAPNMAALVGALAPAGFTGTEVALGPSAALLEQAGGPHHFRAVVHGLK